MNKKMYVGNLSYQANESEIRELFEAYGGVNDVFIVKNRESGRPRGFAFVTMDTVEQMTDAVENLNGVEFLGRTLTINEARPREERPHTGHGNYNHSGGRRAKYDRNDGDKGGQ